MAEPVILIADPDPQIVQALSWVLKEHGYAVVVAARGEDVEANLTRGRVPDLVLLDLLIPGADGYQLLERMKSQPEWRQTPVLIVSSVPPEEAAVRALGLGAADFVRKPFRTRELVARIQAQLRMRTILRSANDMLHHAEQEVERARSEAETRRKLVDILHDVGADLSTGEIYHLLARRAARALNLAHCSVILTRVGERARLVATAFEAAPSGLMEPDLDRYPEVRRALDTRRPVLVDDIQQSPLFARERERWQREGTRIGIRSVLALPFTLDPAQGGVFFLRRGTEQPPLTESDVEFADTMVRAAVAAVQRAQALEVTQADNKRLERLAQTDPLTRVLNRRALTERLSLELERVHRYESTVSLLLIDLDHFKQVNDVHGHLVGDDVLVEMAALLQSAVRAVDVVARYGGEEFVVVLPETGTAGAHRFAERLREMVEGLLFAGQLRMTASIGVATAPAEGLETVEDLLAAADQALYRAKADGRNRVVAA